jgi:heme exporter protein D
METFLKADIFFVITAVAVVVLSVLVGVAVVYLIRILKNVREISDTAKREADLLAADIDDLRTGVKTKGNRLKSLFKFGAKMKSRQNKKG